MKIICSGSDMTGGATVNSRVDLEYRPHDLQPGGQVHGLSSWQEWCMVLYSSV